MRSAKTRPSLRFEPPRVPPSVSSPDSWFAEVEVQIAVLGRCLRLVTARANPDAHRLTSSAQFPAPGVGHNVIVRRRCHGSKSKLGNLPTFTGSAVITVHEFMSSRRGEVVAGAQEIAGQQPDLPGEFISFRLGRSNARAIPSQSPQLLFLGLH